MEDRIINPRIVFFGTPDLAARILHALALSPWKPILVVTAPDRPKGRGRKPTPSSVKGTALDLSIPCEEPLNKNELRSILERAEADLGVLAAYGMIIPEDVLLLPRKGIINAHFSLLPRHRGASPVQTAILERDDVTGVTLILMDGKIDHGPVLASREYPAKPDDPPISEVTAPLLQEKLADLASDLLSETIPRWLEGDIHPREQDHEKATFTEILTREHGRLDWSRPARDLEAQVRAFLPWPGSFTFLPDGKRLKILRARTLPSFSSDPPGMILASSSAGLCVQTREGALCVVRVQAESGRERDADEFLKSNPGLIGTKLD